MDAQPGRATRLTGSEEGFGLIELTIAMTMMAVALLVLVAALTSGEITLQRAGAAGTAGTLADRQMEKYRAMKYANISLNATAQTTANADTSVYAAETNVSAAGGQVTSGTAVCSTPPCWPDPYNPRQTLGSSDTPDKRSYRVDTYIYYYTPTGAYTGRQLKLITVVVRDANNLTGPPLAKVQSRFDQATGQ
jgi:type II secretory pathway pseudopilin PulG